MPNLGNTIFDIIIIEIRRATRRKSGSRAIPPAHTRHADKARHRESIMTNANFVKGMGIGIAAGIALGMAMAPRKRSGKTHGRKGNQSVWRGRR
jgi:hypothetical protein